VDKVGHGRLLHVPVIEGTGKGDGFRVCMITQNESHPLGWGNTLILKSVNWTAETRGASQNYDQQTGETGSR